MKRVSILTIAFLLLATIFQNRAIVMAPMVKPGTERSRVEKVMPVERDSFQFFTTAVAGPSRGPVVAEGPVALHQEYYLHFLFVRFTALQMVYVEDKFESLNWNFSSMPMW